jgi:hypothetical protein
MDNKPTSNENRDRQNESRFRQTNTRRPVRRRKRRRNLLPVLAIGVIGVIIIALIIMGLRSIFSSGKSKNDASMTESSYASATGSISDSSEESVESSAAPTPTPAPSPASEADITGLDVYTMDSMVLVGNSGYQYYKFNNDVAISYIKAMNKAYTSLSGKADMYNMIIPSSIDIMLPLSFLNQYADKTSDQKKAIDYITSSLDTGIKSIPLYDVFKAHCDEKLYFSTDNHWTDLAAYYAYNEWADILGVKSLKLTDFTVGQDTVFTGNLYQFSGMDRLNYSETLEYYQPAANLTFKYSDNGDASDLSDGQVFVKVDDAYPESKFMTFLGGSHAYSVITNNDITDNSSCIMVIDSNGTALAPYIATNYQTTYVVDYRYYSGSISALVNTTGAKQVFWAISIVSTSEQDLVDGIANVNG